MKKLGFRWITALAAGVMLLGAVSCSDDDSVDVILPPTLDNIAPAPAGSAGVIKFTAQAAWEISSDKIWLDFSPATGEAGEQTVNYTINYKAQDFDKDVTANVTLAMAGQTSSFTVVRQSKPREITYTTAIIADGGKPATDFAIVADEGSGNIIYHVKTVVKANFDWKIASYPDWVIIDADRLKDGGVAGEETTLWLELNTTLINDAGMAGVVTFADASQPDKTPTNKSIKVTYGAPDANLLIHDLPATVSFAGDGSLTETSINPNPYASFAEPVKKMEKTFTVTGAAGHQCYMISMDPESGAKILNEWSGWAAIKTPEVLDSRALIPTATYNLTVQRNGEVTPRELMIYIIPASQVEAAENGLTIPEAGGGDKTIVNPAFEKYFACTVKQDGMGAGMYLGNDYGQGLDGGKLTKVTDATLIEKHGTDVLYELVVYSQVYKLDQEGNPELDEGGNKIILETHNNTVSLTGLDQTKLRVQNNMTCEAGETPLWSNIEPSPQGTSGNALIFTWKEMKAGTADKHATIRLRTYPADPWDVDEGPGTLFGVLLITQKQGFAPAQ